MTALLHFVQRTTAAIVLPLHRCNSLDLLLLRYFRLLLMHFFRLAAAAIIFVNHCCNFLICILCTVFVRLQGEYDDSEIILRWIRAHDDVATVELGDSDFEDKTDSYSPSEGALDWFVML